MSWTTKFSLPLLSVNHYHSLNQTYQATTMAPTQPPYPLYPSIIPCLAPDYAAFYNTHLIHTQQSHLQPISLSRTSGTIISGSGPARPVATTTDHTLPRTASSGPPVPVRVFTPLGTPPPSGWPVCIYIHGGGWVLGDISTENVIASHLCSRARCVVVAVDYRLAPEDPFPAAVEDCWEVVLWVRKGEGKEVLGVDGSRVAVGGSSAGANLAAVICQRVVEREAGEQWLRVMLLSVLVGDNTAGLEGDERYPSWKENRHVPALSPEKMLWYRGHYLPRSEDWEHPEASPLLWKGDWARLPKACMVMGELDILRSEGEEFARLLREAGVRQRFMLWRVSRIRSLLWMLCWRVVVGRLRCSVRPWSGRCIRTRSERWTWKGCKMVAFGNKSSYHDFPAVTQLPQEPWKQPPHQRGDTPHPLGNAILAAQTTPDGSNVPQTKRGGIGVKDK